MQGTGIAALSCMGDSLKGRIRAHAREHRDDADFADRLLALAERIENEFDGEQRARLLALAQQTFDRHVSMHDESDRVREGLAALRIDQRRLLDLLDFLSEKPAGARLH
jgi:hypothetical protein